MNDKYEERLGTDRMLPLVFRMALPAVIAQIVNLRKEVTKRVYFIGNERMLIAHDSNRLRFS
jgi:hypothetical protein